MDRPVCSLSQLTLYMLKLGTLGFGGAVALVGFMHRDLVEKNQWISAAEYKEGMTLAQLSPGPLAAQLAIYIGFCRYRLLGATSVGLAFVLPSFVMVVALGWVYVRLGGLHWMQAVFYGVAACIIGIIAHSAQKLTVKTLGKSRLLWMIFVAVAMATAWTQRESILLILVAGLLSWVVLSPREKFQSYSKIYGGIAFALFFACAAWVLATAQAPTFRGAASEPDVVHVAADNPRVLADIFWYFTKAGTFVFGSGLAIVPFLFGGVVRQHHWLTSQQFLDAVAVAMITPGPVVITTGFIGYLVAGFPGACVAALATFVPCYLFTVLLAPVMKRHGANASIFSIVNGITAAATGAIAGAVFVLGRQSIIDVPTALIALASYLVLRSKVRVPEPVLIAVAAVLGLAIYPLVQT